MSLSRVWELSALWAKPPLNFGNASRAVKAASLPCRIRAILPIALKWRYLSRLLAAEVLDERELSFLNRFSQFAAVSAREAVRQSGLEFRGELADRSAVITGSSIGGQFSEEEGYRNLYLHRNPRVAPLTIPRTMSNSGASRISVEHGIQGPTYTVSTACSSANHALGQAFWMVRSGAVTAAMPAAARLFSGGLPAGVGGLARSSPDSCRPFSKDRRGLILGEGGAMLVLENWEHAAARGAVILAKSAVSV